MTKTSTSAKEELFRVDAASGDLIFPDAAAFQLYAMEKQQAGLKEKKCVCLYIYKGSVYDATEFAAAHPGGMSVLEEFNGKDITVTFHDEYYQHGHTAKALNMLLQYRVGSVERCLSGNSDQRQQDAEYEQYKLEELTAYPKMTATDITYKEFTIRRDKGMLWQAASLPLAQYEHLISTPIYVPYCRLFDYSFFEIFSTTKYWVVLMLWTPLVFFWLLRGIFMDRNADQVYDQTGRQSWIRQLDRFFYYPNNNLIFPSYPVASDSSISETVMNSVAQNSTKFFSKTAAGAGLLEQLAQAELAHTSSYNEFNVWNVVGLFLFGFVSWTFMEYFIHRVVFHFERAIPRSIMDTFLCKYLHLLLHGVHHIIPMDPGRLVFPPALFVATATVYYNVYSLVLHGSFRDIFIAGQVSGYLAYDMTHYYIHHVEPSWSYYRDLKKYHHAHHYVDDTKGYGITSKFWDLIFGTACKKY